MISLTEGVPIGVVSMTPDHAVQWSALEFVGQGTLLTSPEAPDGVAETVARLAIDHTSGDQEMEVVDINDERALGRISDVMYKMVFGRGLDTVIGLSALRANVSFEHGVRLEPEPAPDLVTAIGPHYYASPRYYAAFLPHAQRYPARPVWAMSFEEGRKPLATEVPDLKTREAHIKKSVEASHLSEADVAMDGFLQNILISRTEERGKLRIVILDLLAARDYDAAGIFK